MEEPSITERVDRYKKSLSMLYDEISQWVAERKWRVDKTRDEIFEPRPGKYEVDKLKIVDENGADLAEVLPGGAWIIGADGRADLKGPVEKEILVYWEEGAPIVNPSEEGQSSEHGKKWRLFKGAEKEGWYWIEDRTRGKAHPLTKELFMDLVDEVSLQ